MSSSKKDFYNVKDLSEWFRTWSAETKVPTAAEMLVWQGRFQLAIAQQLSVISSNLGKIVGKAEALNDQNTDGSGA